MTKIKICGLSRMCDIDFVNELMPDYIGFVFAPGSKRYVSPAKAAGLRARLDPWIKAVGVFAGAEEESVSDIARSGIVDMLQLHGSESADYIRRVRAMSGLPVIKAFSVETSGDAINAAASPADLILLDNGAGGTGAAFDWSLAAGIERPFFLAGGLTPQNVRRAIEETRPFAVDTSSGVETNGLKDYNKIRLFIEAVRSAIT